MKSSILNIMLCLVASFGFSQIRFEGSPIPVEAINSPFGQNYLVLDPLSGDMAFTEESTGSGDENFVIELSLDSSRVFAFKDWLATKGMVSPVGFIDGNLLYSHVVFDKGAFRAVIISQGIETGKREKVEIPFMKILLLKI